MERRLRFALAGLLHDVGKFAHRAGVEFHGAWADQATRSDFRYAHAWLTHAFVNAHLPTAWGIAPLAAYHHAPKNTDHQIIRLADQLSAGERASNDPTRDDSDRTAHPKMLHPIFTQVELDKETHPNRDVVLPLVDLRLDREVLFPTDQVSGDEAVWRHYAHLWERFTQQATALKQAVETGALTPAAYLEAMQALLMRFTWAIPAAYWQTYADISLYDHSRMTAALAVCLSEFASEEVEALQKAWQDQGGSSWEAPVALLVGGDISGVQRFIYTISAKGAAKGLRGRSFYLQLLTEAVLRFVLRELGLPYTNVIYSGGGNFFLLAPLSARETLPDLQRRVAETLWRYHGTDLYLVLGTARVPLKGFARGAFPDYWGQMHADLQQRKARRYAELGANTLYDYLFAVPAQGGNPDAVCSVCGSEAHLVEEWDEWQGQERICSLCRAFVGELGQALPRARGLRWTWHTLPPGQEPRGAVTYREVLHAFGAAVQFLGSWDEVVEASEGAPGTLWLFDDPEEGAAWPAQPTWLRYVVTQAPAVQSHEEALAINERLPAGEADEQPARAGAPKTFGHLQVQTEGGFHRLGVLRMDVDHLGRIFREGLGDLATLSRLAALSFQMDLFFEGWVKRIIAEGDLARLIYAVYAGGDDLFLVGPWDRMPDLALRIVDDFTAYTGGHPALHLSGGMAFIHGKYPIYQAAEDAGEAEEQAKREGRNRFAFLGRTWTWEAFRDLRDKQACLQEMVRGSGETPRGHRSLLHVLQNLAQTAEEAAKEKGKPVWGPWMWKAVYQLTRMEEQEKDDERKEPYRKLKESLEAENYATLPEWGVAARWAELILRKRRTRF